MRSLSSFSPAGVVVAGLLAAAATSPVAADSLSDVRIHVDARTAGAVTLAYEMNWTTTEPRASVRLYLAKEVDVSAVESGGRPLGVTQQEVAGTGLRGWEVQLPNKLAAGKSAALTVRARIAAASRPDLRLGAGAGCLLSGSGWFPQAATGSDALVAHTTTFALPAGLTGIGAGTRAADGSWQSEGPARPYAVWGTFASSTAEGRGAEGAPVSFELWRTSGASGTVPDLDVIAGLIRAIEVGIGPARGTGPWKLVDVDLALPAGGARTLFWDEAPGAKGKGDAALLRGRDLAGAAATALWTESASFRGKQAAFLSRGIAHYLGDIGFSAWTQAANLGEIEAVTIRARRDAFTGVKDRPLAGLTAVSPDAAALLATRGALVAHQLAGSFASERSRWLLHLRSFRDEHATEGIEWDAFAATFREGLAAQVQPFLETTDLPDFRIVAHAPRKTEIGGMRYVVEIENRGKAAGWCEVATSDAKGRTLYETRITLKPGEKKDLRFADPERVARIVLDPRGIMLQRDLEGETVNVKPSGGAAAANEALSYPFRVHSSGARMVKGFRLELQDASITDFDGWIVPYATEHGASGACLIGSGTVTLSPSGKFAQSWTAAMGRGTLTFPAATEMWIRFPVEAWKAIEPQLGKPTEMKDRQRVMDRQHWIHGFSFPAYFADRDRALIPPAGSTVVIFTAAGGEWRGFARVPQPDGTVLERMWDHLQGKTVWELRR